jgi:hypothetical protein
MSRLTKSEYGDVAPVEIARTKMSKENWSNRVIRQTKDLKE